jgi:spore maturation protein CgeB
MRTFEAIGYGSFLLTDYTYGMEMLFKVGEELVFYDDADELVELVKYII